MSRGLRWRLAAVAALVLFFAFVDWANFVDEERRAEAWYLPDDGLRLGLDLQGGIHWVLGPRFDVAVGQELNHLAGSLKEQFKEEDLGVDSVLVDEDAQRIRIQVARISDLPRIRELIEDADVLELLKEESGGLELALTSDWVAEVQERAMLQVLEVVRRRVTDSVPESVVTRQGTDRILVQIPGGILGRERAGELIKRTGRLEFRLVEDQAPTDDLLRAKHPDGLPAETEILFERDKETDRIVNAYLMPDVPAITGDYLSDARVGFDNRKQEWLVNFTFNRDGGKIFSKLTEENVGRLLGIVIENEIYSAPVIRSRIGARGQIEGNFSSEEARDLALTLRSGALPIPNEIEEERTVGPALGADSIQRGLRASAIGLVLVVAFSLVYYRLAGAYAAAALFANLVLLLGIMSMAGATLTLPGIAGLVLTVGMAIDANVIIFERIREELRAGKTPRAAVGTGFSRALWTILDANITTLITAIVLYEFGTGPIKGFAVTLSIGIVTSVFAALVLTRLFFQVYPGPRHVEALSI